MKTISKILGLVMLVSTSAQAVPMLGLYPVIPAELTVAARDLAQVAEDVVAKESQCVEKNAYGAYVDGGGCNRFGCWPAGGSCNQYGCSMSGACTSDGCTAKIDSFKCEMPRFRGDGA